MIDVYYWPTPNGWKITIALEELELPYRVVPVDITRGAQHAAEFVRISPNRRMPAIVDHAPLGGGEPIAIFESGAILPYLAEKTGRLMPADPRGKYEVLQWVAWQVAGLGPMAGQLHHFQSYAPEKIPYAIDRYRNEVNRLYGVLDQALRGRDFLAGSYSIADIACYPWILPEAHGQDLAAFPDLARWYHALRARPAVQRGRKVGAELARPLDEEAKKVLFGQTAASAAAALEQGAKKA
ncbi:MAG: glutathione S-transferase N-terminal domain-containing protein [Sandaracinaceae bacterium]